MEQFINGTIWNVDRNALDAVAKARPATMTMKAVDATVSAGSVTGTPGPASLTMKGIDAKVSLGNVTGTLLPASVTMSAVAPSTTASNVDVTPTSASLSFSALGPETTADGAVTTEGLPATFSFVAIEAKAVAHVTDIDVEEATLYP